MRTRSRLDICLPLAIFAVLCGISVPTMIAALGWMTIGLIAIGHRAFDSFPNVAPDNRWRTGYRVAIVHFYHLAWWPWYKRFSLLRICRRMRRRPRKLSQSTSREKAAYRRQSNGEHRGTAGENEKNQ